MKMRTAFYAGLVYAEQDNVFQVDELPDGSYVYVNAGQKRWFKYAGHELDYCPDPPKDLLMLVMLME